MINFKITILLILLIIAPDLFAVKLTDKLSQGSIVSGYVNPNIKLKLMDRDIKVHKSGLFVFGVARDAPTELTLTTIDKKNQKNSYSFPVTQRKYKVQRIYGVPQNTVKPPASLNERIKNESEQIWLAREKNRNTLDFLSGFIMPLEGPITGVYGSQRFYNGYPGNPHYGLDIAAPLGTPVYAPAPGVVELTHPNMFYSGGTLIISHGFGVSSTYIHLSEITVNVGQKVKRGQLIAKVGASGRATGPHLDWRINWFDVRLDPQLVLKHFPLAK